MAIEAFEKDSGELWQLYLQDFIHYMLHLEISPLTEQILQPYIAVEEDSDVLTRLVKIHVYLRLHKLDLAKVERILKPISKIQPEANPAASVSVVPLVSSSTLAALVVDVFFNYISYLNETDSEKFEQWYGSYRDIVRNLYFYHNIAFAASMFFVCLSTLITCTIAMCIVDATRSLQA